MKDNIILIGFMGCGKTSVGIRLSYKRRQTMIDTDKWIEKKQKKTVSEIFETCGEEAFRRMETQCLEDRRKADHFCGRRSAHAKGESRSFKRTGKSILFKSDAGSGL